MDMSELHKGDHVAWRSHGGTAERHVEKKITERTDALHRPAALHRKD